MVVSVAVLLLSSHFVVVVGSRGIVDGCARGSAVALWFLNPLLFDRRLWSRDVVVEWDEFQIGLVGHRVVSFLPLGFTSGL